VLSTLPSAHPVIFVDRGLKKVDLSISNADLSDIDFENSAEFEQYIFRNVLEDGKFIGYGGYGENRVIYKKREHFGRDSTEQRSIHLGTDIWAHEGTPVFALWEGVVHSFRDNFTHGDYGPTIVLQHAFDTHTLYSLYGHLNRSALSGIEVNRRFNRGQQLGLIGGYKENGHWPPHLHLQLIRDIGTYHGDYPGVCLRSETGYYLENCPNPELVFCQQDLDHQTH
jgi:murein DD-endopeptidase MepM/ murein hydrolase activator NlpD